MRAITVTGLLLLLAACAPPKPIYLSPGRALAGHQGPAIIHRRGADSVFVTSYAVLGDTLHATPAGGQAATVHIPIVDITRITEDRARLDKNLLTLSLLIPLGLLALVGVL